MSCVRHEWPLYIASKRDKAGRKVEDEVHLNRYTERKASTTTIQLRNEAARQAVLGLLRGLASLEARTPPDVLLLDGLEAVAILGGLVPHRCW